MKKYIPTVDISLLNNHLGLNQFLARNQFLVSTIENNTMKISTAYTAKTALLTKDISKLLTISYPLISISAKHNAIFRDKEFIEPFK